MPDFADRRRRALAALNRTGHAEALLVCDLANVAWVSGFTGSNASALLTADRTVLATDGRYRDQARQESPEAELVVERDTASALLRVAREIGLTQVAFESDHVSVAAQRTWANAGGANLAEAIPTASIIAALRAIKDPAEVAILRRACEISTAALLATVADVRQGMSEISIARALEAKMGEFGADDRAFPTIVAAGENSAVPHHQPTSRPLRTGDLLKIDFGARLDGYHADCTRTYIVGADPEPWQQQIHDVVAAAAEAGRAALRPGMAFAQVDAAARDVVVAAGYGDAFSHGLGHGVGLEIHESPLLAAASAGTLAAGVVATVEPGIYLVGKGGVRIEDTCLVSDDGAICMTTAPRELIRVN